VFGALGRFSYRHRWLVILSWLVVFACAAPVLPRVEEALKVGGFSSPRE
jgi:uncharacterized membrane protein YdfJ with MMPL/SSD domain